jgi:hypothetical protein
MVRATDGSGVIGVMVAVLVLSAGSREIDSGTSASETVQFSAALKA